MCGYSFHHQGDLTRHSRYCTGQPTVAVSHFNVPVGVLSNVKVTLQDTQSFFSSILSPECTQGQAVIIR